MTKEVYSQFSWYHLKMNIHRELQTFLMFLKEESKISEDNSSKLPTPCETEKHPV